MTSSILPPRSVFAPCSPMTHASASTTLDLPDPFGPTTHVTPGSKLSVVADANDLKPRSVRVLRCTDPSLVAAPDEPAGPRPPRPGRRRVLGRRGAAPRGGARRTRGSPPRGARASSRGGDRGAGAGARGGAGRVVAGLAGAARDERRMEDPPCPSRRHRRTHAHALARDAPADVPPGGTRTPRPGRLGRGAGGSVSAELGEPERDLARGGLGRVRAVHEVLLDLEAPVAAEVAADGAGERLGGVRRAGERAEAGDDALTLGDDREDLAGEHEVDERLEERLALVLGVVGGEQLGGRVEQAHGDERVALGLDAPQDLAGQATADAVGLDEDEG